MMGHEFDHYPKGMIRNAKNWDWFLEERRKDSEDEEDVEKQRRKMRGKRKMGKVNEDDEWCGGPTKHEIPEGEERLRAICTSCGKITYQNPKMVNG